MPAASSPSTDFRTRLTALTPTSSHGLQRAGLQLGLGLGARVGRRLERVTHLSMRVLCTLRVSLQGRPCWRRANLIMLNSVPCAVVG